jgi:release factor glutamine methyltransferase
LKAREAVAWAARELAEAGVDEPRVDAELLAAHVLGVSRAELWITDAEVPVERLRELVSRRRAREPLAYVLGEWGFRRLTLRVDRRALVPRPETEVVVDRCLALVRDLERPRVLDVGVGSGAIALALADEHPGAQITGIDSSERALALARENAERTGLAVELVQRDLGDGLPAGPWDLVVSNPPYIPAEELAGLAPEVRSWEPTDATLDRGQTAVVIAGARSVLAAGGWLVLETHWKGAPDVVRALEHGGYRAPRISRDLAGRERVVEGQWPG